MLSSSFFEFDYLVRLAVHFGDASSVPDRHHLQQEHASERARDRRSAVGVQSPRGRRVPRVLGRFEREPRGVRSRQLLQHRRRAAGASAGAITASISRSRRASLLRSGADRLRPGRSRQGERSGLDRSEAEQPDGQDVRDRCLREIAQRVFSSARRIHRTELPLRVPGADLRGAECARDRFRRRAGARAAP